jgi:hypothetical protein
MCEFTLIFKNQFKQLKATLFIDGEPDSTWSDFQTTVLSTSTWIDVSVKLSSNTLRMQVKDKQYTKTHRFMLKTPIRGDLFIGGHPSNYLEFKNWILFLFFFSIINPLDHWLSSF